MNRLAIIICITGGINGRFWNADSIVAAEFVVGTAAVGYTIESTSTLNPAFNRCCLHTYRFVYKAIAVVIEAVAELACLNSGSLRAAIFASVIGYLILIVPVTVTLADSANAVLARRLTVVYLRAGVPASTAIGYICLNIKAFIYQAVTIIIECIA